MWNIVHNIQHDRFKYGSQAPRTGLTVEGIFCHGQECLIGELQLYALEFEKFLVLLYKRVFGFCKYSCKGF